MNLKKNLCYLLFAFVLCSCANNSLKNENISNVIGMASSKLNLTPVYPLTSDLRPGDIFMSVTPEPGCNEVVKNNNFKEVLLVTRIRQPDQNEEVSMPRTTSVKSLRVKIKELEAKLKDMRERFETSAIGSLDAPAHGRSIPTDWKIVKMDRSGKEPFINLGRADNVKPPLTFSIHGQGADGKPLPATKGTLEVINVTGDHLSQAQILSVKDAMKDPILEGDFLYNPVFHPGAATHRYPPRER